MSARHSTTLKGGGGPSGSFDGTTEGVRIDVFAHGLLTSNLSFGSGLFLSLGLYADLNAQSVIRRRSGGVSRIWKTVADSERDQSTGIGARGAQDSSLCVAASCWMTPATGTK